MVLALRKNVLSTSSFVFPPSVSITHFKVFTFSARQSAQKLRELSRTA